MSQLTRMFVLLSLAAAIGTAAYTAAWALPILPWLCCAAAILGAVLVRVVGGRAVLLFPIYLSPVVFLLSAGNDFYAFAVVWISALVGGIAGSSLNAPWSIPRRWRWPIVFWAMVIAASWPIVSWRELDFTFPLVWDGRLPVANLRLSAPASAAWTAFVAVTHLSGLLWVDWLFREYSAHERRRFDVDIALPLALSLGVACLVGLYQGFFDISFLSGHVWPSIHRASGTLMDGNVFGMLAALWAPTFLVLGVRRRRREVLAAAGGFALAWGGVWTSGSRTALLAAAVGTMIAALEIPRHLPPGFRWRRWGAAVLGSATLLMLLVLHLPFPNATAIQRAREVLPSLSWNSSARAARMLLWQRDGYGEAAVAMIAEFPWFGVGVGSYHTLIYDYAREVPGVFIPRDNAQNWFRHQLTELGLLGSIGWLGWVMVFARTLWPRRTGSVGAGAALRGPLIGFALASLFGMPGQDPAVVITFWTLVFWYTKDAGNDPNHPPDGRSSGRVAWAVLLVLVGAYAVGHAVPNDLRPPFRAARFGFPYAYGVYRAGPNQLWTARHGVTVLAATGKWLKVTLWVNHPDADKRPVEVDVWKDHEHFVNQRVFLGERVTRYVPVFQGKRFVLEARVDRTFRPSDDGSSADNRDLGVYMTWEFVSAPPR